MASYAPAALSEGDILIWRDYLQHASGAARTSKLRQLTQNLSLCRILPSLFRAFAGTENDVSIPDMGILFCLFLLCQFPDAGTAPPATAQLGMVTYGPRETFLQGTNLWVLGAARRVAAPTAELIFATVAQRFRNDEVLTRVDVLLQPLRTDGDNDLVARLGGRLQTLGVEPGSERPDGRSLLFGFLSSCYETLMATHPVLGGHVANSTGVLSDRELQRQTEQIEVLQRALEMLHIERAFETLRIG
jgi:hypothetical protein